MAPPGKGGGTPGGALADQINTDFGNFDKFKQQFSDAAKTVEGSGWALLLYDNTTNQLVLTQIEKQNNMHLPQLPILLTLDVWEHAFYLDYLNDKAKYVDEWWKVVNFDNVADRFDKAKK
jgi:Fe-Mn family superoxide dismutase